MSCSSSQPYHSKSFPTVMFEQDAKDKWKPKVYYIVGYGFEPMSSTKPSSVGLNLLIYASDLIHLFPLKSKPESGILPLKWLKTESRWCKWRDGGCGVRMFQRVDHICPVFPTECMMGEFVLLWLPMSGRKPSPKVRGRDDRSLCEGLWPGLTARCSYVRCRRVTRERSLLLCGESLSLDGLTYGVCTCGQSSQIQVPNSAHGPPV